MGPAGVADWVNRNGWMYFVRLDGMHTLNGVYTVAWRFTDSDQELWTHRINRFKWEEERALKGTHAMLTEALPALLKCLKLSPAETGMTVALSSGDTAVAPEKPLPRVAQGVCATMKLRWLPKLLRKEAHRPLHRLRSADSRDGEVAGKYTAKRVDGLRNIFIFDDIVTRGSTLSEIARSILKSNPSTRVFAFALGKSERSGFAASRGVTIDNAHVPKRWDDLWTAGENAK